MRAVLLYALLDVFVAAEELEVLEVGVEFGGDGGDGFGLASCGFPGFALEFLTLGLERELKLKGCTVSVVDVRSFDQPALFDRAIAATPRMRLCPARGRLVQLSKRRVHELQGSGFQGGMCPRVLKEQNYRSGGVGRLARENRNAARDARAGKAAAARSEERPGLGYIVASVAADNLGT
jgi:hypothetical protein